MPELPFAPSGLDRVYRVGRFGAAREDGPGIALTERRGVAVVQVAAWDGDAEALRHRLAGALAMDVPGEPNRAVRQGAKTVIWGGPARWLVLRAGTHGWDLAARLRRDLGEANAAVVDVSQGRRIVRIEGPDTRRLLAKGCAVDLDPAATPAGHAVLAPIGHVASTIHLVDDTPTADVMVARSMVVSFWEWLTDNAREHGYSVRDPIG